MSNKSLLVLNSNIFNAYKKIIVDDKNTKISKFKTHNEKMNHFDLDFPSVAINEYTDFGFKYGYTVSYHGLRSFQYNENLLKFITFSEFVITSSLSVLKGDNKILSRLIPNTGYDVEDVSNSINSIVSYYIVDEAGKESDNKFLIYNLIFYMYFYTKYRNSYFMTGVINESYDKLVSYILYNVVNNNMDLNDARSYNAFFKSIKYKVFYKYRISSFIEYMKDIYVPACVRAFE